MWQRIPKKRIISSLCCCTQPLLMHLPAFFRPAFSRFLTRLRIEAPLFLRLLVSGFVRLSAIGYARKKPIPTGSVETGSVFSCLFR